MKNSLRMMVIAFVLSFGIGTASANTQVLSGWSPVGNGWGLTFSSPDVGVPDLGGSVGFFDDDYTFLMPNAVQSLLGGAVTISGFGPAAPFFNTVFDNFVLTNVTTNTVIGSGVGGTLSTFNFAVPQANLGDTFKLHLDGHIINPNQTATYSGSIQVSPVPEPETYAMLLVGLGLVGFAARRRTTTLKS